MIQRLRDFFRYEPVGVTVPIGVVLGYGMFFLVGAIVSGFALPILVESTDFGAFSFTVGGVEFNYYESMVYTIALLVTALVAYFLLIWRRVDERDVAPMRECPECLSEIDAQARRCAFCASPVEPVAAV